MKENTTIDKKYNTLIVLVSIVIPVVVAILFNVKLKDLGYDVEHIDVDGAKYFYVEPTNRGASWQYDEYDTPIEASTFFRLKDYFNDKLGEYIENVPSDWDMIYFGANHNYHMGMKTLKINDKCIKLNKSYSAHCVLLKKQVFEELIQNIKNFSIENDVMMANLQNKYNAYSSSEALASQIESYSNIENKVVNYDWLIK
jgi:hypothetical protein